MADAYVIAIFKCEGFGADKLIPERGQEMRNLENLIRDIRVGKPTCTGGYTVIDDSGTEPTGTVAVTAANMVSGTSSLTFTLFTSAAVTLLAGTDFEVDTSSDGAQADLVVDAINKHPVLSTLLYASRDMSGVITIGAKCPGDVLENIALSEAGTAFTISAQIGAAVAGADGDAQYFFQGRRV